MSDNPPSRAGDAASFFSQASASFGSEEGIRRFPHFGRRLVEVADLADGMRVLDVATGRGAVLFPAAERVGVDGYAVGIDLAPGMIQATIEDAKQRGIGNIDIRVMDAEQIDLPDASFDALFCGFGVMFFPHLSQALAGFRRVLKPGGLLAVSTWATSGLLGYPWEMDLWRAYGIFDRHAMSLIVQQLSDPRELGAVLSTAGFRAIEVRSEVDNRVHADEDEWWARTRATQTTRDSLESLGAERLERFQADAYERLRPLGSSGGIPQRVEALFGLARNP